MGNMCGHEPGAEVWKALWLSESNEVPTCSLSYQQLETVWKQYETNGCVDVEAMETLLPEMLAGLELAFRARRSELLHDGQGVAEAATPEDYERLRTVRERYRCKGNAKTTVEVALLRACKAILEENLTTNPKFAAVVIEAFGIPSMKVNKLKFTSQFSRVLQEVILKAPPDPSDVTVCTLSDLTTTTAVAR